VPSGLVGLSNGRPLGSTDNGDGTTTSRWRVSYPINNYDVTVNVGPYRPIEERYHGVDGTLDVPILFWALPEHLEKARRLWTEAPGILEVLGRRFGEYPFLRDKYWAVEAPYLGMEHQTLIAYGSRFADNRYGFDWILLHETAHEWWGNKVTAANFADLWLHEGFATYAEALYVNDTQGVDRYLEYMQRLAVQVTNRQPIVPGGAASSREAYTRDIYTKGACVLHTLRWLLGDEAFFEILHDFPNDPRFAYRSVTTGDFTSFVDSRFKGDLSWFWERYLHRAALPEWDLERHPAAGGERAVLSWNDPAFQLPLPVRVGGRAVRLQMSGGRGEVFIPHGAKLSVDPDGWILARAAGDPS
jgi:aminopeptidase N